MTPTKPNRKRRTRTAAKVAALVLCFCPTIGCRHGNDLVEAELRTRDHDLREMRDELHCTEAYNEALQHELRDARQSPGKLSPEQASLSYTLRSITLGRQTGGLNDDDVPGDEALQVTVEPLDPDGHAIKAPGTLQIHALEITPEGVKRPLSTWTIGPEQLRRKWRSGLLSTGYYVVLPWKCWPSTEKVRVVAQFSTGDGRVYEADKDVTIRLAPQAYRKPAPPDAVEEVPLDSGVPLLPPPRKVEPPTGEECVAPVRFQPIQLLAPVPMRRRV